jgi:hypothetical protein
MAAQHAVALGTRRGLRKALEIARTEEVEMTTVQPERASHS